MKLILLCTIILASITANCQQKTLNYYDVNDFELLKILYQQQLDYTSHLIYVIDSTEIRNETDKLFYNARIKQLEDSLNNAYYCFKPDTFKIDIDTLYVKISDSTGIVLVDKKEGNLKIKITDNYSNRIYITRNGTDFDTWVQSGNFTRYSNHIDLR